MQKLENYDTRRGKLSEALKKADSLALKREVNHALLITDICFEIYKEVVEVIEDESDSIEQKYQDLHQDYKDLISSFSKARTTKYNKKDLELALKRIRENEETPEDLKKLMVQVHQTLNETDDLLEGIERNLKEREQKVRNHLKAVEVVEKYCAHSILKETVSILDNEVFGAHDNRIAIQAVQEILDYAISISPIGPIISAFQAINSIFKSRVEKIETADSFLYSIESYSHSAQIWALTAEASLLVHKRGADSETSDILSKSEDKIRNRMENHSDQLG